MRFLRGFAALIALTALLAGVPWALSTWGRLGALATIDWSQALTTRDDGTLLLGVLTGLGWIIWLILAASIIIELVDGVRHTAFRPGRAAPPLVVPGLELPRALVRGLVTAAIVAIVGSGSIVAPASGHALSDTKAAVSAAAPGAPLADGPRSQASSPSAVPAPPAASLPVGATQHVVASHDDLWSLAVTYYGDGTRWRLIADANPGLVYGEGELQAGSRLVIPETAPPLTSIVVVKKGDTLWALAAQHLGDPQRWPEIFAANRDVISNPDLIDVGWRLRIPMAQSAGGPAAQIDATPSTASGPASTPTAAPTQRAGSATPTLTPSPVGPTSATPVVAPEAPRSTTQGSSPAKTIPSAPTSATVPSPPITSARATAPPITSARATAPPTAASTPVTAPGTSEAQIPAHDEGLPDLPVPPAVALVGGVSAVLAGGIVTQLRRRRSLQLAVRPVGRRIMHPNDGIARVATALGQIQTPGLLAGVDAVTRDLGADRLTGRGLVMVAGSDGVSINEVGGGVQQFRPDRVAQLLDAIPTDGPDLRARPLPALVAVGTDASGRQVLLDLEAAGLLTVELEDPLPTCVAIGLELACSPWAEGATIVASGVVSRALSAELENVIHMSDVAHAADQAKLRIVQQRAALERSGSSLAMVRGDDDTRDAWAPQVYLFGPDLSTRTAVELRDLLASGPDVAVAVVLAGRQAVPERANAAETLVAGEPRRAVEAEPGMARIVPTTTGAILEPFGLFFTPQQLPATTAAAVAELLAVTGSDETTVAPWFEPLDPDVISLHPPSAPGLAKEAVAVGPPTSPGATDFSHPTLLLMGPIELVGAAGPPPPRAERSCIEYCAWLLEHPNATATMMANSLVVAEGTRRSNVSRLRTWLGHSPEGDQYLPDAYSGRLLLDACVSSDWHRLQLLVAPGIARVSRETLIAALQLVRGAPLADAAPGQWHWAEELRTDMSSTIRDIGVILAEGAIADGEVDLARWATARALTAAPEDELLLCSRLKAEHRAGNRPEVERLVLRLTRHARLLGIDLADETVLLMQEVIEGRPRARA